MDFYFDVAKGSERSMTTEERLSRFDANVKRTFPVVFRADKLVCLIYRAEIFYSVLMFFNSDFLFFFIFNNF